MYILKIRAAFNWNLNQFKKKKKKSLSHFSVSTGLSGVYLALSNSNNDAKYRWKYDQSSGLK